MDEDWAEVHAWLLNTHGTVSFGQYAVFTATFFLARYMSYGKYFHWQPNSLRAFITLTFN